MSITPNEQKKSVDFMNALNEMLNFVESVLPYIKEDEYITAMNALKKLNDNKLTGETQTIIQYVEVIRERIRTNPIVTNHVKRIKMKVKDIYQHKTDGWKLVNGWTCCRRCNRLVKDIEEHNFTDVCKRIKDTKKLSATTSSVSTDKLMVLILTIRAWACKNAWRGDHIKKFY